MTAAAHDGSTTSLSELTDPELRELLEQSEREERQLSRQRNAIHKRIEFVQAGGFASADQRVDDLAALVGTEHQLSERRHELHGQIDELRAEQSRRGGHWPAG